MNYLEFIAAKAAVAPDYGFEPSSDPHDSLFPHQVALAKWACRGGQRAIFASFGLGKTRIHLQIAKWIIETPEASGKRYLIVAPLGVRQEFTQCDGPAMGERVEYVRTDAEINASTATILITNYERVRDEAITVDDRFIGAGLDEASVLRSFGSKTYQTFLDLFADVKYRFVFTATPAPNRYKELIHYAGFLGVMDTGQALTRFFGRNSEKANDLTLYPHMEAQFWMWLSSWAAFLTSPADLGFPDTGYNLPKLNVHWHKVDVDHTLAWSQVDSWGQRQMFVDQTSGLKEAAEIKRNTLQSRLDKAIQILGEKPRENWLIWHDLEDERRAIESRIPNAVTVYGSQDLDVREQRILGFSRGEYQILATKPVIAGSGCNFQKHCANAVFLGAGYKFNDFIQAVHRIQRFQQTRSVDIHIIFAESESATVETIKRKWRDHDALIKRMRDIIRRDKDLLLKPQTTETIMLRLTRELKDGTETQRAEGDKFTSINNDTVLELTGTERSEWADLLVTSIPFGNQYEYTPTLNDFGHCPDNGEFWEQMDFLIPQLLRALKPGRVAAVHVKDRIRFGNVTGLAMPTLDRFSDQCADRFEKHGFAFMTRITIDTDVVRENNQTYRLGWSENSKDSSKMGAGVPEYVLVFRKLPSDLSNAYADEPVTKPKHEYTRAQWQIDASSLWRSKGDRLPDPDLLVHWPHDQIIGHWRKWCRSHNYDYNEHIAIGKELENKGKLPSSFMLFPPISRHPDVWCDIARMRVLNSEQGRRSAVNHVCPLQLDIVERLIRRYSNPGDIVMDPFGGIGTVPYLALKMGRRGWMCELNEDYWKSSVGYCEQAEREHDMPTLFDLTRMEVES